MPALTFTAVARLGCVIGLLLASLTGCTSQSAQDIARQFGKTRPSEFLQTSSDRMATLAMQANLQSLYRLMNKLYLRNPAEWKKTGLPDAASAEREIRMAIEQQRSLPALGGRKDVAALSYVLGDDYQGDRVGAFIYAIGSMIIAAHGNRTEFYITDVVNARFVNNAARNIEKATWLLGQRKNAEGEPLLFANEISEEGSNLSFATEFGKIVARLDLLAQLLDERYRRIGVNYAQSLLFLNFLPVQ